MTEEEKKELEAMENAMEDAVGIGGVSKTIDEVLELYPDGVTLTGCTKLTGKYGDYYCVLLKEDNILVPATRGDFGKLIQKWLEQQGDEHNLNKFLNKFNYFVKLQNVPWKGHKDPYLKVTSVRRVKADEGD